MTLPSILYGLFLLSVVGLYWALERRSLRIWLLLIASIVFYTSLQVHYVPLMLVLVGLNFWFGQVLMMPADWRVPDEQWQMAEQQWYRRRRYWLTLGIVLNVFLLLGFKYVETWLLWVIPDGLEQTPAPDSWLAIAFPLGLSFFTFECIAYLVDVYRGAPATNSLTEFAAYKLYFPKLISGPITRFHSFTNQLTNQSSLNWNWVVEGLWLIGIGAIKKILIADHIGTLVNLSLDNLERAGSWDLWLAIFAYGLQLYLDFSGYVDVARGSALLMGIHLPQNFNFPYFTTSIADFWRRWHITLGDWLRNYLYFPLGGSRRGLPRTAINLMIVMLIAGVWHGNTWGFVIWGGIHGLALVIHRINHVIAQGWQPLHNFWTKPWGIVIAWALTQVFVFFSWLFFRLPEPRQFSLALQKLWGANSDLQFSQKVYAESLGLTASQLWTLLWALVGIMGLAYFVQRELKLQLNWPVKLLLVPLFLFVAWQLAPSETLSYIYFDF
ncbi:MBOAT family protein [Oscillatoria sp. CS-180]|uniref:MBOAT family O-acyltransferase n=1 Tax=Oscillatoria sp. CS-180 TaxID=3021720 RepID=UPI00232BB4D8|nr:MBOAT family protein [Oscillatoria sp. CS-180]MDB9529469.1 MBOAT family protein [Oscillatoria sp. CS-180]